MQKSEFIYLQPSIYRFSSFGSFSRFYSQVEYNASLFQFVLQRWHVATMCFKGN